MRAARWMIIVSFLLLSLVWLPNVLFPAATSDLVHHAETKQAYQKHDPIYIQHESDFSLLGFPGEGTQADPFVIENLSITSSVYCFNIEWDIDSVFIIRNCKFRGFANAYQLVRISRSDHCTLENLMVQNAQVGVYVDQSYNFSIISCVSLDCETGFDIRSCRNVTMTSSIAADCSTRIYCSGSSYSSYRNNKIYSNTLRGLQLTNYAHNNSVIGNYFGWNGGEIEPLPIKNIIDDGQNNTFDDGVSVGNHYHNYDGTGVMEIDGDAGSVDHFPTILSDTESPVIEGTYDLIVGADTATVRASMHDEFPLEYTAYLDSVVQVQENWVPGLIEIRISDIEEGSHNLTIQFTDGAGNSKTINLEVYGGGPMVPNIALILGVAAIIVGIMAIEFYRRRRL